MFLPWKASLEIFSGYYSTIQITVKDKTNRQPNWFVYSEVPNSTACSLKFFKNFCHPARRCSTCSFNKSKKYFLPARLFRPACLEIYQMDYFWPFLWSFPRLLDFRKKIHPAHLFRPACLYFYKNMSACLFVPVCSCIRDFRVWGCSLHYVT